MPWHRQTWPALGAATTEAKRRWSGGRRRALIPVADRSAWCGATHTFRQKSLALRAWLFGRRQECRRSLNARLRSRFEPGDELIRQRLEGGGAAGARVVQGDGLGFHRRFG